MMLKLLLVVLFSAGIFAFQAPAQLITGPSYELPLCAETSAACFEASYLSSLGRPYKGNEVIFASGERGVEFWTLEADGELTSLGQYRTACRTISFAGVFENFALFYHGPNADCNCENPATDICTTQLRIDSPADIAGLYDVGTANGGPAIFASPVLTGDLVIVESELPANAGTAADQGCFEYTQASKDAVAGKIALIRRGGCFFQEKIDFAQNAGAVGYVIYNHEAPAALLDMTLQNVAIPGVLIKNDVGVSIVEAIENGETVTISLGQGIGTTKPNAVPSSGIIAIDLDDLLGLEDDSSSDSHKKSKSSSKGKNQRRRPRSSSSSSDSSDSSSDSWSSDDFDNEEPSIRMIEAITSTNAFKLSSRYVYLDTATNYLWNVGVNFDLNTIQVFDLNDGGFQNPKLIATLDDSDIASAITSEWFYRDGKSYLLTTDLNPGTVFFYDVTDPTTPTIVSSFAAPGIQYFAISSNNKTVFIQDGSQEQGRAIKAVNIADIANPIVYDYEILHPVFNARTVIFDYEAPEAGEEQELVIEALSITSFALSNNLLFVTWGAAGISVYDVTNVGNPIFLDFEDAASAGIDYTVGFVYSFASKKYPNLVLVSEARDDGHNAIDVFSFQSVEFGVAAEEEGSDSNSKKPKRPHMRLGAAVEEEVKKNHSVLINALIGVVGLIAGAMIMAVVSRVSRMVRNPESKPILVRYD